MLSSCSSKSSLLETRRSDPCSGAMLLICKNVSIHDGWREGPAFRIGRCEGTAERVRTAWFPFQFPPVSEEFS
jgi:hypothetical protein